METAKVLAANGARHVILGCRDGRKAKEAIQKIEKFCADEGVSSTPKLSFIPLDLADQDSIRSFAREFEKMDLPLDVLINNAG
jgi:NAD(P)-dependent dehydrogenase (short-subunit alcohol dehydrogenase family)